MDTDSVSIFLIIMFVFLTFSERCHYRSHFIFNNKVITMELNDPLIESVLIHLYLHPGGTNIAELVGEYQLDDVLECLVRNGMIKVSE